MRDCAALAARVRSSTTRDAKRGDAGVRAWSRAPTTARPTWRGPCSRERASDASSGPTASDRRPARGAVCSRSTRNARPATPSTSRSGIVMNARSSSDPSSAGDALSGAAGCAERRAAGAGTSCDLSPAGSWLGTGDGARASSGNSLHSSSRPRSVGAARTGEAAQARTIAPIAAAASARTVPRADPDTDATVCPRTYVQGPRSTNRK
jgi:hypothetical protein